MSGSYGATVLSPTFPKKIPGKIFALRKSDPPMFVSVAFPKKKFPEKFCVLKKMSYICSEFNNKMFYTMFEDKFYLSDEDFVLGGVCGGLAEYFEVDSEIVRWMFVISSFMFGFGAVVYLLFMIFGDHREY